MGLGYSSSVDDLLERVNFLTPHQSAGIRLYLDDMTVERLLGYGTAQELADDLEREAREQYELSLAEMGKSAEAKSADEFLRNDALIKLADMGDVAYKLLSYLHRMFDQLGGSLGYSYVPR